MKLWCVGVVVLGDHLWEDSTLQLHCVWRELGGSFSFIELSSTSHVTQSRESFSQCLLDSHSFSLSFAFSFHQSLQ